MEPNEETKLTDGRVAVVLGPAAAAKTRDLAERMGITVPEVVRRALSLYSLGANLKGKEYLAVRRGNGDLEKVIFDVFDTAGDVE